METCSIVVIVRNLYKSGACSSKPFILHDCEGVVLYNVVEKTCSSYVLAARSKAGLNISKCLHFDPNSDGSSVWDPLHKQGKFDKVTDRKKDDHVFGEMAIAVAAQVTVPARGSDDVEMCLVWDIPVVSFVGQGRQYTKFYSKMFGREKAPLKIVDYTLKNYARWEEDIWGWQKPILDDK